MRFNSLLHNQSSEKPFVIAEIGVNHNGSLETARDMIRCAAEIGADAVKFQSFKADKLSLNSAPKVPYQMRDVENKDETHHEMLKRLEMSEKEMRKLSDFSYKCGVMFLSTPYDPESVTFLAEIGVAAIKVASADIVDYRIHNAIRSCRLPLIQGLGMSSEDELRYLVDSYYQVDPNYPLILLQCTSNYPADPLTANIRYIKRMKELFPKATIGFSDHTRGYEVAILALAAGACIFEKHFTLDCSQSGPDHKASCDPDQLKEYIQALHRADSILGKGCKYIADEETDMRRVSRKGCYLIKAVKSGEIIDEKNIQFIRPAFDNHMGVIAPYLGGVAARDLEPGKQLVLEDFEAFPKKN